MKAKTCTYRRTPLKTIKVISLFVFPLFENYVCMPYGCVWGVYDECVGIIMGMTRGCTRTFPFSNTLCALKSLLEDDQQMSWNITTHAQLIFYYYFGGKCVYVVDELVGWLVRRLMDTPRLDHVSCGHRRAHRCQSIILSAASDLKWPFKYFVWPDCIDHSSNELGVLSSAHQFTVIILFRASQMVKRSTISHAPSFSCASVEFPFLWDSWCGAAVSTGCVLLTLAKSAEPQVFSLYKTPLHPGPPAVACWRRGNGAADP